MKEIKAILQRHMVGKVVRALHELPHFPGLTLTDARGRGAGGSFKITEGDIEYHPKAVLEVVCADNVAAEITRIIQQTAHTGRSGDGIVIVTNLAEVIRIRTDEQQESAV